MTQPIERKLAAILAAHSADDEGTLARLKTHRREVIDPRIAGHRGRIVKTIGDGLLVEFGSVVDACAARAKCKRVHAARRAACLEEHRREY
jgi:adenylate cyclase